MALLFRNDPRANPRPAIYKHTLERLLDDEISNRCAPNSACCDASVVT
jgi:hypothetical protein